MVPDRDTSNQAENGAVVEAKATISIDDIALGIKDRINKLNTTLKPLFREYNKNTAFLELINLLWLVSSNLHKWSSYKDIIFFADRLAMFYKNDVNRWPDTLANKRPSEVKQFAIEYIKYIIVCLVYKLSVEGIQKYIEYVARVQLKHCDELAYKMLSIIGGNLKYKIYNKLLSLLDDIEKDNGSQSTESYGSASDSEEDVPTETQSNGPNLSV